MADRAYLDGLRLLARRELSEAQVRQRLARRQHAEHDIDAAIRRLTEERALDDVRTARAIARTCVGVRRLGPRRVRQALDAAGIAADVAEAAAQDAFADTEPSSLVAAALERRLTSHVGPVDERTAARLFRHLVGRGFDAGTVARALRARRRAHGAE